MTSGGSAYAAVPKGSKIRSTGAARQCSLEGAALKLGLSYTALRVNSHDHSKARALGPQNKFAAAIYFTMLYRQFWSIPSLDLFDSKEPGCVTYDP